MRVRLSPPQLVVGTSEPAVVFFDVERRLPVAATQVHQDDVNAMCYAGGCDPNIVVSGSDDTLLRVFDRRMVDGTGSAGPVGGLPGHTEGVTHLHGRDDGRYILSNGKDQTARLWDLRGMVPAAEMRK